MTTIIKYKTPPGGNILYRVLAASLVYDFQL